MRCCLSTTTITLMDGWTTAHTEKLRAAVKDVVAANPILSGKVVAGEGGKGLAIAPADAQEFGSGDAQRRGWTL